MHANSVSLCPDFGVHSFTVLLQSPTHTVNLGDGPGSSKPLSPLEVAAIAAIELIPAAMPVAQAVLFPGTVMKEVGRRYRAIEQLGQQWGGSCDKGGVLVHALVQNRTPKFHTSMVYCHRCLRS